MLFARPQYTAFLIIFLLVNNFLYGQDSVKVQMNFHDIDKDKLVIHFDDGIVLEHIDLKQVDLSLTFCKPIYTTHPALSVSYEGKNHKRFLMDSDKIVFDFFLNQGETDNALYVDNDQDLIDVYDTTLNTIYGQLLENHASERASLNAIMIKHGHEFRTNDSIKYVLNDVVKIMNTKSMDFLVPYAEDFFSFYYFKDQILGLSDFIEVDTEHYIALLRYYNNTFPEQFRSTEEGRKIVAFFKQKISPVVLKENEVIPNLDFLDIYGTPIFHKDQKEDFVLLDFWATWCAPCIQQIPDIKRLRDMISTDKLKIVGISIDRDSTSFIQGVKEHNMHWDHSFDRGGVLSERLGITSIPRVVLLDRNGKILYYKTGGRLDVTKINAILKEE